MFLDQYQVERADTVHRIIISASLDGVLVVHRH